MDVLEYQIPPFQHQSNSKTCKCATQWWNTVNQRQSLSTNAKACYDKLGEKVVAPLWFDKYAQKDFQRLIFSSLGLEFSQLLHFNQRLSVYCNNIKRKMCPLFFPQQILKPISWKIDRKSCMWWLKQVSKNKSKLAVAPHNSHFWCRRAETWGKRKRMADKE